MREATMSSNTAALVRRTTAPVGLAPIGGDPAPWSDETDERDFADVEYPDADYRYEQRRGAQRGL
jgi:hypothetical protein